MTERRDELSAAMRMYARLVYSLAYSRTQNHADAEDIFQEVFLRLAQRSEPFENEEHRRAWLIRVTTNLSINLIASAWRRHVTLREYLPERRALPEQDAPPHALDLAMRRLPEKDRVALYLRYCEEMSAEEIARHLQISLAAARKRITRAKKRLEVLLKEADKEEKMQ